jgi:hypothetical protein
MSLWVGQAVAPLANRPAGRPAADLVVALVSETERAIRRVYAAEELGRQAS